MYFSRNNNNSNIIVVIILLFLIYFIIKYLKLERNDNYINGYCNCSKVNEYYNPLQQQRKILKATNPGYLRIVSTDDNGSLGSFEFPKGIIVAWSGDINKIPDGWALCDGTLNTPDLRGKFILGSNPNANKNPNFTISEMNTTGGEEKHTLTKEEIPSHSHEFCWGGGWADGAKNNGPENGSDSIYSNCRFKKIETLPQQGVDKPHNNMPPYFTLAFIMKL